MTELTETQRTKKIAELDEYESVYKQLISGLGKASIDHSGSTTSRSVSFAKADIPAIKNEINQLRRDLGMPIRDFTAGQLRPVAISLR